MKSDFININKHNMFIIRAEDKTACFMTAAQLIASEHSFISYKAKRKWYKFKPHEYEVVIMKLINYPKEIRQAIKDERYEDAEELRKDFEQLQMDEKEFENTLKDTIKINLLELRKHY